LIREEIRPTSPSRPRRATVTAAPWVLSGSV